jgi:integrase
MARPRKHGLNLPTGVVLNHGAYFYRKGGKWTRLADDLPTALREYGRKLEAEGAVDDPNTLPRLLDKFVIEHAAKKKPKTLEMYDRCVGLLKPIVADFRPHQLTASDLTQIVRAVSKRHGATTANQCRATLSAAFSFAIDLGLATSNPVRDTKKIAIPKRRRYVENAELEAIGGAGPPVIRAVIDLAYVTGQRISDVLDLSLDAQSKEYVTLVQRKTGHRMKLRRTRGLITVINAVTATCEKQLRKSAREQGVEPETIVFNSLGLPYTYDGFSTLWQRARKESGIQDARIHDVRAKAITDAEELGMDAQTLAGHASRTTTEGYIRRRKAFIAYPLQPLRPAKKRGEKA